MSARRSEQSRELCRRLAEDVAAVSPPDVGKWPPAWEVVEAPSARFLELLNEWVECGNRQLIPDLRSAYDEVVEAWRFATAIFLSGERIRS